jgi:hypothetical protein
MVRKHFVLVGIIVSSFLAGCSVTGTIMPVVSSKSEFDGAFWQGETTVINSASPGGNEYRIFNQGANSFVPLQGNREDAEERATKFCAQKEKTFRPLRETVSKPPHVMGNFPRVELIFECIDKKNPAVANDIREGKYAKLGMLKNLLDDGALAKDEYEIEKKKILNEK